MSIFEDRPAVKAETKPTLKDKPKVSRYWPGKAPEWASGDHDEDEDEEDDLEDVQVPIKVEHKSDRRLERLKQEGGTVDKEEALQRRKEREVVAEVVSVSRSEPAERSRTRPNRDTVAEIVSIKTELPDEEVNDELTADARRERAREEYLRKRNEEVEAMPVEEAADEAEEEGTSGSEYETDSDYDEWSHRPTVQPVFVKREERETIIERDRQIEEEERLEKLREEQAAQRQRETLQLLKAQIQQEAEDMKDLEEAADRDERVESDEEEEDEAKEYELWKQRELLRIKRDKEEREAFEREREETERRRQMSDAEIRMMDKDKFVKNKKKWKFLQKYYHKGAFYQGEIELDVTKQDYSAATGDDLVDKTLLPKVMQVKNFGRSGRTKYTHLADQDTSAQDSAWAINDALRIKYNQKMGGMHGGFERPALKKRKAELQ